MALCGLVGDFHLEDGSRAPSRSPGETFLADGPNATHLIARRRATPAPDEFQPKRKARKKKG